MSIRSLLTFTQTLLKILSYLVVDLFEWILPNRWCMKDVSGDTVLITGAGSGLGREIALKFAAQNSSVVLWDINVEGLKKTKDLVDEIHQENKEKINQDDGIERVCLVQIVDVSDRIAVQKAAKQVSIDLNSKGEDQPKKYISVLVNNAGIYHGLLLQDLKDEQIERVFKINILSHFWTVRAFLPQMIDSGKGHIVEIASMGGIAGLVKQVDYCATKFATVGFEESLSSEFEYLGLGEKIRTTSVCPLFFSSNLFTGYAGSDTLMTAKFVAEETVTAMRCNYSRVLLPKLLSYSFFVIKSFLTRRAANELSHVFGFVEGIKNIKGKASESSN